MEQRIKDAVNDIKARGVKVESDDKDDAQVYRVSDSRYLLEVVVSPNKWIGLDFELKGTRLFYKIDTDLYDVTSPANQRFVEVIVADIAKFLYSLVNGELKLGTIKGRPAIVFPEGKSVTLLKQGRFIVSKSSIGNDTLKRLLADGNFSPLHKDK